MLLPVFHDQPFKDASDSISNQSCSQLSRFDHF